MTLKSILNNLGSQVFFSAESAESTGIYELLHALCGLCGKYEPQM